MDAAQRQKTVCVTGASGYLGSVIVSRLVEQAGYSVRGSRDLAKWQAHPFFAGLGQKVTLFQADLTGSQELF